MNSKSYKLDVVLSSELVDALADLVRRKNVEAQLEGRKRPYHEGEVLEMLVYRGLVRHAEDHGLALPDD